jgi:hypothetical protein
MRKILLFERSDLTAGCKRRNNIAKTLLIVAILVCLLTTVYCLKNILSENITDISNTMILAFALALNIPFLIAFYLRESEVIGDFKAPKGLYKVNALNWENKNPILFYLLFTLVYTTYVLTPLSLLFWAAILIPKVMNPHDIMLFLIISFVLYLLTAFALSNKQWHNIQDEKNLMQT